ncbi:MAG TPA: hypothetical protein VEC99_16725, partial [Clostridia bacterium]|nr:hypothetical protein [Clostridia bacterium]
RSDGRGTQLHFGQNILTSFMQRLLRCHDYNTPLKAVCCLKDSDAEMIRGSDLMSQRSLKMSRKGID